MAFDFKVASERENKLLARKEVVVSVIHSGEATPSRINLQQLLAKALGADPEFTEIWEIRSERGESASRVRVNVWKEKKVGIHQKKTSATKPAEKK